MSKRKRGENEVDTSTLHTQGFVILPGFIEIPEDVKNSVYRQSRRARPIFGPDRRRKQCTMYAKSKYMQKFKQRLDAELDPIVSNLSPNFVRDEWQILFSAPGCKRQQSHTDYEPRGGILDVGHEEMPLAAVLALEDQTNLVVWPNFIGYDFEGFDRENGEVAEFNAGDLLIFRGDLVHAGAGYPDRSNVRLHCFIDNQNVDRKNNRTFIVK
jgi:hypothetical protein